MDLFAERGASSNEPGAWGVPELQRNVAPGKPTADLRLSLLLAATWLAATALSWWMGMWVAVGGAALGLGPLVTLLHPRATGALLRPSLGLVLLGAAAGALLVASSFVLWPLLDGLIPSITGGVDRLYTAFRAPPPLVTLLLIAPVTLGEELVWRGSFQNSLVVRLGAPGGVIVSAVVYALANAPFGSLLLVLVAFPLGLAWGVLRELTGSLVPSFVAHLSWSAFVLILLPLDATRLLV